MAEEDRTAEILGRHLGRNFTVFPMTATDEAAVRWVASSLGIALPAEYVAHLSGRFQGIYVEAKDGDHVPGDVQLRT